TANLNTIEPFYLRSVPFLLFSDPQLVARNLTFWTRWSAQGRQPTRLSESGFELGRSAYRAEYFSKDRQIYLNLVALKSGELAVGTSNDENPDTVHSRFQFAMGNQLLDNG